MAEGWDWVRVQEEPCPFCGFDPEEVPHSGLADAVREEARRWEDLLASTPEGLLRAHPVEGTWSALEYGCHVRDVFSVLGDRIVLTLQVDDPDYGWWDHEASVVDEHYNEQDPVAVAGDLGANAERLAEILAGVHEEAWGRAGRRRDSEPFTVAGLGRFALHEATHHRQDADERLT
jgi:DinB superfamily